MGCNKKYLVSEEEMENKTSDAKAIIYHLPWVDRCTASSWAKKKCLASLAIRLKSYGKHQLRQKIKGFTVSEG